MTPKSAGNDESHVRPGEVQVPLPAEPDAQPYLIGRIRTPLEEPQGVPEERPRLTGNRHSLHHRGRSPMAAGHSRGRDLLTSDRALLDGPGAARPRGPSAGAIRRWQADLFPALAGAA